MLRKRVPILFTAALFAALAASPAAAQDAGPDGPSVSRLAVDETFARKRQPRFASARRRLDAFDAIRTDAAGRFVVAGRRLVRGSVGRGDEIYAAGVARFLANGRIDRTFGRKGVALLPVLGFPTGLAIDAQGRILLTGYWGDADHVEFVAARLTADGRLDPSFSEDGLLDISGQLGGNWRAGAVAPDGSLLAAASNTTTSLVVRVSPDGTRDGDYGAGGAATAPFGFFETIAVDGLGRAVVAADLGVVRFRADGSRDTNFGAAGALAGRDGGTMHVRKLAHDAQGRVLAIGGEAGERPSIHRFLPDGARDLSFSADGRADWAGALPADVQGDLLLDLAVSPGGDRFASAANAGFLDATGSFSERGGICIQTVDASDPESLGLLAERNPSGGGPLVDRYLAGVTFSASGDAVVAVGTVFTTRGRRLRTSPLLMRVVAAPQEPVALPDIAPTWDAVRVGYIDGLPWWITADLRVRNDGDAEWGGGDVQWFLSEDATFDASDILLSSTPTGRIPAHSEVVFPEGSVSLAGPGLTDVAGMYLLAVANRYRLALEADTRNDVGASMLIE